MLSFVFQVMSAVGCAVCIGFITSDHVWVSTCHKPVCTSSSAHYVGYGIQSLFFHVFQVKSSGSDQSLVDVRQ